MKQVIVDTNTWACVFDENCKLHSDFKPVNEVIFGGKRQLVWGGSGYWKELKKSEKYLKLHEELGKVGLAQEVSKGAVDLASKRICDLEEDGDFDDPHIIAIEVVSKAGLIVTKDKRAHKFIKKKELYPKRHRKPKIYGSLKNKSIL